MTPTGSSGPWALTCAGASSTCSRPRRGSSPPAAPRCCSRRRGAATTSSGRTAAAPRAEEPKKPEPYGSVKPTPTPLRNHLMLVDILDGKGPIYMRTEEALKELAGGDAKKLKKLEGEAWEDFLDMTISQALVWAGTNIAPE